MRILSRAAAPIIRTSAHRASWTRSIPGKFIPGNAGRTKHEAFGIDQVDRGIDARKIDDVRSVIGPHAVPEEHVWWKLPPLTGSDGDGKHSICANAVPNVHSVGIHVSFPILDSAGTPYPAQGCRHIIDIPRTDEPMRGETGHWPRPVTGRRQLRHAHPDRGQGHNQGLRCLVGRPEWRRAQRGLAARGKGQAPRLVPPTCHAPPSWRGWKPIVQSDRLETYRAGKRV